MIIIHGMNRNLPRLVGSALAERLRSVKRAIDRDYTAGLFLLMGSANLLLMHNVSETLAGRASYLTLCR